MIPFVVLVLIMIPVLGCYVLATAVIILGALKMRRLESYGLATTAAVLAVLPWSPLWLLGLPMGIWALVVLSRPDVKAAFRRVADGRTGPAEYPPPHPAPPPPKPGADSWTTSPPRICKLPVVGAVWAPFGPVALVGLVLVLVSTPVQRGSFSEDIGVPPRAYAPVPMTDSGSTVDSPMPDAPKSRPKDAPPVPPGSADVRETLGVETEMAPQRGQPMWLRIVLMILAIPIGLLGATAPFGSTTLGCLGISRIRASRGRLIGMPLAVGVALFYPLLILDAVMFLGVGRCVGFIVSRYPSVGLVNASVAMLVVAILLLDFFIVRAVWRAATSPTRVGEPA